MNRFMYYNPTKLLFGKGQLENLPKELSPFGKRVLLVYGGGSVKRNGVYDAVMKQLSLAGAEVYNFAGVESNPRVSTVRKAAKMCKQENIDFVLALGGGSVIDCVKAIIVAARTDVDVWDIITRKVRATEGLPYGSIVTLAGTGAELSLTSVISNPETNDKRAWSSSFSRGQFAIVDPTMMKSVPLEHTVNGTIDAMSHVLEHYFNRAQNTPIQDQYCEAVLRTVIDVTPKMLANLENETYRETIAYASTLALSDQLNMGMIGDWGTHHIDHALSAVHDVSHGGGMAILFPHWMRYVLDETTVARFKQLAVNVLQVETTDKTDMEIAREGIERLASIWDSWGAPTTLSDYDVPEDSLDLIARKTLETQPNCGNFRQLTEVDVRAILQAAL